MDYLELPIIPGVGLAGIKLGDKKRTVIKKLGKPCKIDRERYIYSFLEVFFSQGCVDAIAAWTGYKGSTPEGLKPGATYQELIKIYHEIFFDDRWRVPGIDGLFIFIARPMSERELSVTEIDDAFLKFKREEYKGLDKNKEPWVAELYEIMDPENAVVDALLVESG